MLVESRHDHILMLPIINEKGDHRNDTNDYINIKSSAKLLWISDIGPKKSWES